MESSSYEGMSGTNTINTAAVLLETGLVEMVEPVTEMVLEAPAGLVRVRAECADGRVERITFENVPSFVEALDAPVEVPGRRLAVASTWPTAARSARSSTRRRLGFAIAPDEARDARRPRRADPAAREPAGHDRPPDRPPLVRGLRRPAAGRRRRPPRDDRLPRPARPLAHRHGHLSPDRGAGPRAARWARRTWPSRVIDTRFEGRIVRREGSAVVPAITGRAWITGFHQLVVDPTIRWGPGSSSETRGAPDPSTACSTSELHIREGFRSGWSTFVTVTRFVTTPREPHPPQCPLLARPTTATAGRARGADPHDEPLRPDRPDPHGPRARVPEPPRRDEPPAARPGP